MITEEEALSRILKSVHSRPTRRVALSEALDRFTASALLARLSLPQFDNSSMDGYAVVASASPKGARLKIVGEQPAGLDRRHSIAAGEALRILTGAPIPSGADAVVMQEETRVEGDELNVTGTVESGENIRRRGGDVTEGQRILGAGERLRPQTLALLAAQGIAEVEIGREVRAAIVSTGDELVEPGQQLQPGQIHDSNSVLLRALLQRCDANVVSSIHCQDREAQIEAALRQATKIADVLIISGGVSVGARDFVKSALSSIGAKLDLWRVAVKPGKPFLFGRRGECAIFGLPGNPVSAFMTFLLFVRPAILQLMGAGPNELELRRAPATLAVDLRNPGDRPHYVRGILMNREFAPVGRQESHALFGLSRSNAVVRVPAGAEFRAHSPVEALIWE